MNLLKHMTCGLLIICLLLSIDGAPLTTALNCISDTGISLQLDTPIELVEFYYEKDTFPDCSFVMKARLSESECTDLLIQLDSSKIYMALENSDEGYRKFTGNVKRFENKYGIDFTKVTNIYRAWTAGEVVWTIYTIFIFAQESEGYLLTIIRLV